MHPLEYQANEIDLLWTLICKTNKNVGLLENDEYKLLANDDSRQYNMW